VNSKALGLLTLLTSVTLIGITAAGWDTVTQIGGFDDQIVLERTQSISGAELAGGLFLVALLGMVVSGLMIKWAWAGAVAAVLGIVGLGLTLPALGSAGEPTTAPYLALVASGAYLVLAALSVRLARSGGDTEPDSSTGGGAPSRYTVEGARDDSGGEDDEWDLAVAESPPVPPDPQRHEDLR
jgi:hypothetical protein